MSLSLLCAYGSGSGSDSEPEESDEKPTKERLPLPDLISQQTRSEPRVDDPDDHEGKTRAFPHERGNWATYVYIPLVLDKQHVELFNILQEQCSPIVKLNFIDDFHISLSKTVILKYHWIDNFTSSLRESFRNINSFHVVFDSLAVYTNDNDTRTFLGYKVDCVGDIVLKNIVSNVDKVLTEFQLDTFYKDCSFHMSILWCVGNKKRRLNDILPALENTVQCFTIENNLLSEFNIDCLESKSGNKLHKYLLNGRR